MATNNNVNNNIINNNNDSLIINDEEAENMSHIESNLIDNNSYQIDNEINCGVLNWEQVKKLDTLLNKNIPIHGRGNYPTLNVKLKDFIRNLQKRLVERSIRLKDIRINGGVASYVLAKDDSYEFSDIDIIFSCDLLQLNNYDQDENQQSLYQNLCLDSCFSNCCDIIKETVFDCLIDYIPASDVSGSKEKLTWLNIKEAYVKKMVKIYEPMSSSSQTQTTDESFQSLQSLSRWSLISLYNNQGQNIELKFVDKMKRQFQFSVDAFQIHLDSLIKYYDCQDSIQLSSNNLIDASMTEKIYPSVKAESMYGDFKEAINHLDLKLIATKCPEEIRGGGLLKYCNLLIRGYKPECDKNKMNSLEKYMCSRFFIDFSDIKEQEHKLNSYLDSHFQNDSKMCILYLNKLYHVVNASTVCLMGHERKQTLNLIESLAKPFNNNYNLSFSNLNLTDICLSNSNIINSNNNINNSININSSNLNLNSKIDFYLDDLSENLSDNKTFSSSSSEVDSTDSQNSYYKHYFKNNNNNNNNNNKSKNKNRSFINNFNNQTNQRYNYNTNNTNNSKVFIQNQQYSSNFKRNKNNINNNNYNRNNNYIFNQNINNNQNNQQHEIQNYNTHYNYYYYGYYQNPYYVNMNEELSSVPVELKPVDSYSSSSLVISSSISSSSTSPSPSPSPSPSQSAIIPIPIKNNDFQNDETKKSNELLISSGSESSILSSASSSSSSSIASSIVPSPSPSPSLFTPNQNIEENENDDESISKDQLKNDNLISDDDKSNLVTSNRIFYCKLPTTSNTIPYIEVFENCFCPPVLPIIYDPAYINNYNQYYSTPANIITRIIPSTYN